MISDDIKKELKETITNTVRDSFKNKLEEGCGSDKKTETSDEDDEDDDSSVVSENWKVAGIVDGDDTEEVKNIKKLADLVKLAKSGKYNGFDVVKPNGDNDSYIVKNGKLILN